MSLLCCQYLCQLLAHLSVGLLSIAIPQEKYEHPSPPFSITFPSADWELRMDQSAGPVVVLVFSPNAQLSPVCSVLQLPTQYLPQGMETREAQVKAQYTDQYQRRSMASEKRFGRDTIRWEYTVGGGRAVEWGFEEGDSWVIFQISAASDLWEDEASLRWMAWLRDSFDWKGGVESKIDFEFSDKTADAIREQRTEVAASYERTFEIAHHQILATVEPEDGSLELLDDITVVSNVASLEKIVLFTTIMDIDNVESDVGMTWSAEKGEPADALTVTFNPPLTSGQEAHLKVSASASPFIMDVDQDLVAEIAIMGQVEANSSYSSHVVWYPIDQRNDASVDITFDVPSAYTAITGGTLLEASESGDRKRFRYREDFRIPRGLPFGFSVGEYITDQGTSESGLELISFAFEGDEELLTQRTAALLEGAKAFEKAMGPLPWDIVRFVHVHPRRKETGVSLPGMILVSDQYFPDISIVDLSEGNLSDPTVLGVLVVADELSHQWNFYAAGFPNELAEGISTYTNALFVEERHGYESYRRVVDYCREAWIATAGLDKEYAVADPEVYSSTRYRSVVFCKTPVVLDYLRSQLGDDVFFEGFRRAFQIRDYERDGFELMEEGFEEASGKELRGFFDQWFYRAGFPIVKVSHDRVNGKLTVVVEQLQKEAVYSLDVGLKLEGDEKQSRTETVSLAKKREVFEFDNASTVGRITIDQSQRIFPGMIKE